MSYKILIVDDDAFSVQVLEMALKRKGYETFVASNGIQGLRLVQEKQPDLILLDLMLPGIDGYEVLNRIRSNPQTAATRVLILSAKSHEDDQQLAKKIGADGYIVKPYQLVELYTLIEKTLSESATPQPVQASGQVVVFISLPRTSAAPVIFALARSLRRRMPASDELLLADLRPFTTEYEQVAGLPLRPEPLDMSSMEQIRQWSTLAVRHPEAFFVLYNLSGDAPLGGLSPQNLDHLCDTVLSSVRLALIEVPLQASEVVLKAARRARLVLFISSPEAADLMTARSLLQSFKTHAISTERCGLLVRGTPLRELFDPLPVGVKYTLEEPITPESPAIVALVQKLLE